MNFKNFIKLPDELKYRFIEDLLIKQNKFFKKIVEQDPYFIQFIPECDRTEELILAAVTENGHTIQFIRNPSERLQLIAVNENGLNIQNIDNPTEEVQLISVIEDYDAIYYITDPSEEAQLAFINSDWHECDINRNIHYMKKFKNPSKEVQLAIKNKLELINLN